MSGDQGVNDVVRCMPGVERKRVLGWELALGRLTRWNKGSEAKGRALAEPEGSRRERGNETTHDEGREWREKTETE